MPTFKMLRGSSHAEGKSEVGKVGKVYHRGETFISSHDLDKIFNSPNSKKFERLSDEDDLSLVKNAQPPAIKLPKQEEEIGDGLEDMSIPKLREMAEGEEIDIEGLRTKSEIVAMIRKASSEV